MMSLNLDRGDFNKFSKHAEELAESYRKGLIAEGVPSNLANEKTKKL